MRCPAARLCVALPAPWPQRPNQNVVMEAAGGEISQDTLHVQSISYWAPCNIGPYSQAKTLDGRLILISGQIALDPSSMVIKAESVADQTRRCLHNLKAILGVSKSVLNQNLRVSIFVTDMAHSTEVLQVWAEATAPEALAFCNLDFIQVVSLPRGALVELQVACLLTGREVPKKRTISSDLGEDVTVDCWSLQDDCCSSLCYLSPSASGVAEGWSNVKAEDTGRRLGASVLSSLNDSGLTLLDTVSLRLLYTRDLEGPEELRNSLIAGFKKGLQGSHGTVCEDVAGFSCLVAEGLSVVERPESCSSVLDLRVERQSLVAELLALGPKP
eukprot:CAMPEP_0184290288 /NCGR_PEP_ID=MMETSP1049-20130417/2600_1 /TAXON_ID=77928 /ORGANISM="Proteomonas sulcata, Strain CCMP704" /LENGTH=328 /DNA_ID=CAMNT_0026597421 /DNA_START=33 /DNA_END=1019 /DNA_ORIENTATION=-